jgi:hypothetical protein
MSVLMRVCFYCAAIALALVSAPDRSVAQSFFQNLFGFGSSDAPPRRSSAPYREQIYRQPSNGTIDVEQRSRPSPSKERFRTMCVRTCDGYYYPISASVSRKEFHRDANACQASCGSEARLFYHPSSSGDAAAMIDLTGRAYSKLPNAFRYRKSMVDGCRCKPDPWARSEIARHDRYAAEASVAQNIDTPRGDPTGPDPAIAATVIAGAGYDATLPLADRPPIARPEALGIDQPEARHDNTVEITEPEPRPFAAPYAMSDMPAPRPRPASAAKPAAKTARRTPPTPKKPLRITIHAPQPRLRPLKPPNPMASTGSGLRWPGD